MRLSHNPERCRKVTIDPPQIDPERPADPAWARAELLTDREDGDGGVTVDGDEAAGNDRTT